MAELKEQEKGKTKFINHLFHCWINKVKLPRSNCRAALVSTELHIPSNELTSQEEDAPFRQHKSDSCIIDESLSVGEFDVKDWWVLLVSANANAQQA